EIQAWTSVNKLPTNEDKTKVLTITGKRLKSKLNSELSKLIASYRSMHMLIKYSKSSPHELRCCEKYEPSYRLFSVLNTIMR
ncbi:unnamed protein product, partial [Porites evermanni]